jgi:hypothetical protein
MSQIIKPLTSSGPIPPNIPTSFVTDSGTVVPAGNTVNINGGSTTANNANGIRVVANPTGSNNEVVQLTNRETGTTTTAGATSSNVLTLPLGAVPGVYTFDISIAGFNASTPAGCGFTIVGSARTTGAAATLVPTQAVDHFEEAALIGCTALLAVSGNNAVVTVTGVPLLNIDWNGVLNYTFVS